MAELLVIAGGVGTSKDSLDDMGHAAVRRGVVTRVETYTLGRARRQPSNLVRHLTGALSISHSRGNQNTYEAVLAGAWPETIVACDGTEPMDPIEMARRAEAKRQMGKTDPETAGMLRANRRQILREPIANALALGGLISFSTWGALAEYEGVGIPALAVVHTGDVMAPYEPGRNLAGVPVLELPGSHDEPLLRPEILMGAIAERLAAI